MTNLPTANQSLAKRSRFIFKNRRKIFPPPPPLSQNADQRQNNDIVLEDINEGEIGGDPQPSTSSGTRKPRKKKSVLREPTPVEQYTEDSDSDTNLDEVVVEDKNGPGPEPAPIRVPYFPSYLQNHIDIMHFLRVSPIKGNGERGSFWHLVCCVIVNLFTLFRLFGSFKQFYLLEVQAGNVVHYVTLLYYLSAMLLQMYLWWCYYKFVPDILAPTEIYHEIVLDEAHNKKVPIMITLSAIVMVVMAVSSTLRPDWMLRYGDTLQDMLLFRARTLAKYVLMWANNNTTADYIYDTYGGTVTATSATLGIFGMIMEFFGSLQENLTRDIVLMSSFQAYELSNMFKKSGEKFCKELPANEGLLQKVRLVHGDIMTVTAKVNNGFGLFFKLVNLETWLFCSYFLFSLVNQKEKSVEFFASAFTIPKILTAYFLSANAINKTNSAIDLIRTKFNKLYPAAADKVSAMLLLDDLRNDLIGLGRGEFQLSEKFAWSFIAAVISCFVIFNDSTKKDSPAAAFCN